MICSRLTKHCPGNQMLMGDVQEILVKNCKGNRPVGRRRPKREANIKVDTKGTG
jgi:hypothetical protein